MLEVRFRGDPPRLAPIDLPVRKILVTTGLPPVQWQKVEALGLSSWIEAVHIDDVQAAPRRGKRAVFAAILESAGVAPERVVVVGDRLESEIAAGAELGLRTVHIARWGCTADCPGHALPRGSQGARGRSLV